MDEKKYQKGFNRGYNQLQVKDVRSARVAINKALGLNNRISFSHYRFGRIEPKAGQAAGVDAVFAGYGITDIWGE